jgi:ELWxxDGT repeat protein
MKKNYNLIALFFLINIVCFAQQASLVRDLYSGPNAEGASAFNNGIFAVGDSVVLFPGYNPFTGGELYKSDGTFSGTTITKDIFTGDYNCWPVGANRPFSNGKKLFFSAIEAGDGAELWASDGSLAGTIKLKDFNPGFAINSFPNSFASPDNRKVFFKATIFNVSKTCVTDGTTIGTDSTSLNAAETPNLYCNGYYYYTKTNPLSIYSNDIWRIDTNLTQAQFIYDTDSVSHSGRTKLITVYGDSLILYKAQIDTSTHLFTLNVNTMEVTQLPEIHPTYPNLRYHSEFYRIPNTDKVLFVAQSTNEGYEIWVCDGMEVRILNDIEPGINSSLSQSGNSGIPFFHYHQGYAYFYARRNGIGVDIFKTDGTTIGTVAAYEFNDYLSVYASTPITSGAGVLIGGLKQCVGSGCNTYKLFLLNGGTATPLLNTNNEQLQVNDNYRYSAEMGDNLYIIASAPSSGQELYKLNGIITKAERVLQKKLVNFYPNPASTFININNSYKQITILDACGKEVLNALNNENRIDLNGIAKGLYFVKFIDEQGNSSIEKLIVN